VIAQASKGSMLGYANPSRAAAHDGSDLGRVETGHDAQQDDFGLLGIECSYQGVDGGLGGEAIRRLLSGVVTGRLSGERSDGGGVGPAPGGSPNMVDTSPVGQGEQPGSPFGPSALKLANGSGCSQPHLTRQVFGRVGGAGTKEADQGRVPFSKQCAEGPFFTGPSSRQQINESIVG